MSNEVIPRDASPFSKMVAHSSGMNAGAVAIEQERAVAEAQGKLVLAKRFPRDIDAAKNEVLHACAMKELAETAFFAVPRGGAQVTGPTIRLAEEIARCWGNIDYGHRELSRSEGKSEVEVYAWDMQTNTSSRRQITIQHVLDTKSGPRKLTSEKDIDDLIANKASKQLRGRIFAIIPKWLSQLAQDKCRATLTGTPADEIGPRVAKMIPAFKKLGVDQAAIEKWLGHSIDKINADELAELLGIYQSIAGGHAKAEEWFGGGEASAADSEKASVNETVAQQRAAKPAGTKRQNSTEAKGESKTEKEKPVESEQKQDRQPVQTAEPEPPAVDDEPNNDSGDPAEMGAANEDGDIF